MISTFPAVQFNVKWARRIVSCKHLADDKRIANRRHRRALNRVTRTFVLDPDRFDDEGFNAPTLSDWDVC